MKNYCVKKYSVEQLDRVQEKLTYLIRDKKHTEISLNHYTERVNACEKMLKLNEEMRENLSMETYLRNRTNYESDMCSFKEVATRLTINIENTESEIERLREKYCL